jgi:hypothetical protein
MYKRNKAQSQLAMVQLAGHKNFGYAFLYSNPD